MIVNKRQMTLDFLERQRDLDDRSTFQLYLIIETMTSLIEDKDLQEILTTFKNLKQCTEQYNRPIKRTIQLNIFVEEDFFCNL
jgi:hypothetical protein